ncbi:MAG: 50S ribosomal protein L13 [Cyanobacteria bacterium HKST-UBA06]|nr:50S ribosomal protein L13 [Cyanobacteria bacterium HKST-UBA05]MCA9798100.1 50S ribosomal protein L13 [Cyanobacteria bacterium HKST-UBA04]MCA9807410.1 50S ribosomal protein L13 [Cyanobacteria bacterium HKST-UBA06]MCA9841790.1 50S ribosomal protein L13 [Cyanobacteria bacterium HKST-UBA03]
MNKSYSAKSGEVERNWVVLDAKDQTLGRLATVAANLLRGKHKPQYTPHLDTGDFVIVINAEHIQVSGNKYTDKKYRRHSGYPGGFRELSFKELQQKAPAKVIELAVWGMVPHNRLGRRQIRKLLVYTGNEHPHAAQKPVKYEFKQEAKAQ